MIPVEQTISHAVHGNCFEAALASILEVPLADVPVWQGDLPWADYKPLLDDWLEERGLVCYPTPCLPEAQPLSTLDLPPAVFLVGVRTPSTWNHALVVRGGEVLWDPYQQGDPNIGISGWPDPLVDYVFMLIPLDPAVTAVARADIRN